MNTRIPRWLLAPLAYLSSAAILTIILILSGLPAGYVSYRLVSDAQAADVAKLQELTDVSTSIFKDGSHPNLEARWKSPSFQRAFPPEQFSAIARTREEEFYSSPNAEFGASAHLLLSRTIVWVTAPNGRRAKTGNLVLISPDIEKLSKNWSHNVRNADLRFGMVRPGQNEAVAWTTVQTIWVMYVFAALLGLVLVLNQKQRYQIGLAGIISKLTAFSEGDVAQRLSAHQPAPELQQLSTGTNRVLDDLSRSITRLINVTDYVRHEIRNPIATATQRLKDAKRRPDQTVGVDMAGRIEQDLLDATRTIDALAEFVKFQRDRSTRPKVGSVDLSALIGKMVSDQEEILLQANRSLEIDIAEGVVVAAQAALLERIVENLFSNAAKYTPEGKTIRVRLTTSSDSFALRVANTGGGFPEDIRDSAFKFSTRSASVIGRVPGYGLGLALAADIAFDLGLEIRIVPSDHIAEVEVAGPCKMKAL